MLRREAQDYGAVKAFVQSPLLNTVTTGLLLVNTVFVVFESSWPSFPSA